MSDLGHGMESYILLFLAGFCATQPWRYLGVYLSRGVQEDAEVLIWVRAVSTALVAGLVTRMVLLPAGALATVPIELRVGAFILGIALFLLSGKRLIVGVFGSAGALIAAQYAFAG